MKIKISVHDKNNVFFISDFHLYHKNVIKFDNRPFIDEFGNPDLDSMHETIFNNWNDAVGKNDIVFYLGDLSFGQMDKAEEFVNGLNGTIHFVMGNHDDYRDIIKIKKFASVSDYIDLNILNSNIDKNLHFVIMHYPIYSWNRAHHGSYMIHGHCHGNLHHGEDKSYYIGRKVIDVGCNLIDYTPISYKEIVNKLNNI